MVHTKLNDKERTKSGQSSKIFFGNHKENYNMTDAVKKKKFNEFFVNVGPDLADKISPDGWKDNLIDRNLSSMFLTAVK